MESLGDPFSLFFTDKQKNLNLRSEVTSFLHRFKGFKVKLSFLEQ